MEEMIKKVSFNKSGTGGVTPRINLPTEWVKDMEISKEESEISIIYDREKKEITLKKLTK